MNLYYECVNMFKGQSVMLALLYVDAVIRRGGYSDWCSFEEFVEWAKHDLGGMLAAAAVCFVVDLAFIGAKFMVRFYLNQHKK